jgi:hypothetical protein
VRFWSNRIDGGIGLPGINDASSPWPALDSKPDMGAFEAGS